MKFKEKEATVLNDGRIEPNKAKNIAKLKLEIGWSVWYGSLWISSSNDQINKGHKFDSFFMTSGGGGGEAVPLSCSQATNQECFCKLLAPIIGQLLLLLIND